MNTPPTGPTTATVTTTLTIEGMTCGNCTRHVREALVALDGVTNADVNLATRSARVVHRPDLVSAEQLAAAIVEAGYEAAPDAS